jgi:hypothetical protein
VNYSYIPGASATLPVTAGAVVAYRSLWLGIAIAVIGGTLLTVAKFFPRVAVEPVRRQGRHRLGLTINGEPASRRGDRDATGTPDAPDTTIERRPGD